MIIGTSKFKILLGSLIGGGIFGCGPITRSGSENELTAINSTSSSRAFFYDLSKTQKIEIWMPDWVNLANQKPKGGRCNFEYVGDHFDTFNAPTVKINGVSFANAAIKKSSFCGSYSDTKPNLKLNLTKYNPGAKAAVLALTGTTELVLKNSVQDPSLIRQCLVSEILSNAGFPRQYCNFIEVWANNQKVGLYVNLEPNDRVWLSRNLGSPTGNLYEVAGEDLDDWALNRFKRNLDSFKDPEDKSLADMTALIQAVRRDQSPDLIEIRKHLDIDQFIRFWAMEMILVHWDGFTQSRNNSFIYFNPKDGRAMMIPRGMDQVLTDYVHPKGNGVPYSQVFFHSHRLTNKLLQNPRYFQQLKNNINAYLKNVWDEESILAYIDRLAYFPASHVPGWYEEGEPKWSYESLRRVVRGRKMDINQILSSAERDFYSGRGNSGPWPTCLSQSSDEDGDSWGWENGQSCKVVP
jgi:hypothetical protein